MTRPETFPPEPVGEPLIIHEVGTLLHGMSAFGKVRVFQLALTDSWVCKVQTPVATGASMEVTSEAQKTVESAVMLCADRLYEALDRSWRHREQRVRDFGTYLDHVRTMLGESHAPATS